MSHLIPGTTAILTLVIGVQIATLPSADAQPLPIGAEFQVNSYTTGSQAGPKVAANPDGTAFVVWRDASARDGDGFGVFGRLVAANGSPLGADFQVNTTTSQSQFTPVVAADGVGNFVVAWQSALQDGDLRSVVAQRFDSDATPIDTEFLVNTETIGGQYGPQVGAADDGRFVVVFVDDNDLDGDRRGIFARCYDATGAPKGGQFQVNAYTTGFQDEPQAAMAADGSFLVAWRTDLNTHRDGDAQSIVARRFDAQCDPAGDDFVVNTYTTGNQQIASVAALADNGFVLLWDSTGQDGDDIGVFGQRLDSNGNPVGDETQVNSYTTGLQFGGRAAEQDDGTVVVSWTSNLQDGDSYGVYARAFGNSGQTSDEVRVNSTTAGE